MRSGRRLGVWDVFLTVPGLRSFRDQHAGTVCFLINLKSRKGDGERGMTFQPFGDATRSWSIRAKTQNTADANRHYMYRHGG